VMQDPGLEQRYLKGVLPLVADVRVGRTWAGASGMTRRGIAISWFDAAWENPGLMSDAPYRSRAVTAAL